ncbi:glycerol uptake operon antiterminator [Anaerobranca californiensis DSM 14826]|jgi:glycerol uptake operon antiterminator|uniref:Glycerol uptake operon antiterminator n=1 Tax=Anaerobranca californiensis DSM 14826 TaxID=1120989 RepID=A0A1M6RCQ9_9FIRM|nr:glycerol-3-phosphate responsive antiterminator [Anaerobranca californiensis]SHK30127.1 glycerol uptake operon antiterminator [Anaerobranca californiensis DSM 14826]
MNSIIIERLEDNPIIAAVQNVDDLELAISSPVTTIFLLCADIFNVNLLVKKIKDANKSVLIHIDFLEGIGKDAKAIDYIIQVIQPHGIISTRSSHIKLAKERGIFTIQRFFLIDNKSYEMTIKSLKSLQPDMIEIMPGVMPNIINRISNEISTPIIAGGLIKTKQDIMDILKAGALGASTGNKELWFL